MKNSTIKKIRYSLLLVSGILFIYLFWMNFSPIGEQTISYEFKENIFTEGLRPSTRVQEIECQKETGCTQKVFSDPVYFDLLMPRKFQSAKIELKYQDESEKEIKIGVRVGDEWQYFQETLVPQETMDGWTVGTASLDLKIANIQSNTATFMLSIPHIKDNAETINLKEIKLYLTRNTHSNKVRNKLNDWYDKAFK